MDCDELELGCDMAEITIRECFGDTCFDFLNCGNDAIGSNLGKIGLAICRICLSHLLRLMLNLGVEELYRCEYDNVRFAV